MINFHAFGEVFGRFVDDDEAAIEHAKRPALVQRYTDLLQRSAHFPCQQDFL